MKNLGDKISIILPDDLKKEIDNLRDLNREDQSSFIRKLLWKSVIHEKLEIALKEYLNNKISFMQLKMVILNHQKKLQLLKLLKILASPLLQ